MDEKQFPEEYVNYANVRVVEKLHLKRGSRIIYKGYLLDKGAFVIMVDDEVFQFKSAAVAEFVFYAMLQGKTEVMIPENVVEVVHQRKRDLQKMKQKIKAEIEERITDEKGQKLLFKKCLAKLKLSP
jgi:acetyl-CoA carboxylase carboxyltransferase component